MLSMISNLVTVLADKPARLSELPRSDLVLWPLATDRIFMADRFGCEADMAGPAAGSTRS
jgi:hypothetical protein